MRKQDPEVLRELLTRQDGKLTEDERHALSNALDFIRNMKQLSDGVDEVIYSIINENTPSWEWIVEKLDLHGMYKYYYEDEN